MRNWLSVLAAVASTLPGVALELHFYTVPEPIAALIFGAAVVGAAFLLSWASEVVQLDVSQGFALALLALIAILPEYVVDGTFAWLAAKDPAYAAYPVANMTGANRLLIGVAWPLVVALVWLRTRRQHVSLQPGHGLELVILLAATVYAFILPFKGSLSLIDFVVLVAIFAIYIWQVARLPAEEPHLVGPAERIGALPKAQRRLVMALLALVAAAVILLVAEPFATSLVESGAQLGIDQFFLVQWVAPLASEAPEFLVVSLFAWRGASSVALGALVSSKINQWTLLVAMLPLIYGISLGSFDPLPLDARQEGEILLTAGQSLFAILLLLDLRLSLIGAAALFGLFLAQFIWPDAHLEFTVVYIVVGLVAAVISRTDVLRAFRGARTPGER